MPGTAPHPAYAEAPWSEALADSPAVLIHGPGWAGETTRGRVVRERVGDAYVSFGDDVTVRSPNLSSSKPPSPG